MKKGRKVTSGKGKKLFLRVAPSMEFPSGGIVTITAFQKRKRKKSPKRKK